MFSEKLLEHFRNPKNAGELEPPAVTVEVSNPACGDILRLSARVENGVVADARYKIRGCTASIATVMGTTRENAATPTAGTRTRRISSVAYAVDEMASDESTASAVFLESRSCSRRSLARGRPNRSVLMRRTGIGIYGGAPGPPGSQERLWSKQAQPV